MSRAQSQVAELRGRLQALSAERDRPPQGCRFNGWWDCGQGEYLQITDKAVVWPDGRQDVAMQDGLSIAMMCNGERCSGSLRGGKLLWNDGDLWLKVIDPETIKLLERRREASPSDVLLPRPTRSLPPLQIPVRSDGVGDVPGQHGVAAPGVAVPHSESHGVGGATPILMDVGAKQPAPRDRPTVLGHARAPPPPGGAAVQHQQLPHGVVVSRFVGGERTPSPAGAVVRLFSPRPRSISPRQPIETGASSATWASTLPSVMASPREPEQAAQAPHAPQAPHAGDARRSPPRFGSARQQYEATLADARPSDMQFAGHVQDQRLTGTTLPAPRYASPRQPDFGAGGASSSTLRPAPSGGPAGGAFDGGTGSKPASSSAYNSYFPVLPAPSEVPLSVTPAGNAVAGGGGPAPGLAPGTSPGVTFPRPCRADDSVGHASANARSGAWRF